MTVNVGLTVCFLCVKCFYCFTEKLHSSFIFDSGGRVVVVSTDFDLTLLYKLIRNCLTSPNLGWGYPPPSGHINERDDIERIRLMRNYLVHNSELEICDTDFSTHWTDLSQVCHFMHIGRVITGKIIYSYHSMLICRFITGKYIILVY